MAKKLPKKRETLSEKNKKFWALPKAEQRVAIAKDIINQIEAKFYLPESGTYFMARNIDGEIPIENTGLDVILNKMKQQKAVCEVCQIGACFTSLVRLGDKVMADDVIGSYIEHGDHISDAIMRKQLEKVFSKEQLSLVECAFEESTSMDGAADYEQREKAKEFGERYETDQERMIAICKNIIKNKGTFKP